MLEHHRAIQLPSGRSPDKGLITRRGLLRKLATSLQAKWYPTLLVHRNLLKMTDLQAMRR